MIRKNEEKGMRLNDDHWGLLSAVGWVVLDIITWIRLPTVPADRRAYMLWQAIGCAFIAALSPAPYYLGGWRRGRRQ